MRTLLVLVADRNEARLKSYQMGLAREQCAVVSVATADACLHMLREFTPDALVLESELPGVERVLETLGCQPLASHLSVIVQSVAGRTDGSPTLRRFPRSEQIGRPLPPDELACRVHRLARNRRVPDSEALRGANQASPASQDQASAGRLSGRRSAVEELEAVLN